MKKIRSYTYRKSRQEIIHIAQKSKENVGKSPPLSAQKSLKNSKF